MTHRATLEIDEALLSEAQKALGTEGLDETVGKAFREAIRRRLRERLADRVSTGRGIDRSPEHLAESRPGSAEADGVGDDEASRRPAPPEDRRQVARSAFGMWAGRDDIGDDWPEDGGRGWSGRWH